MQTDYAQIRAGSAAVAQAIADVRSARNLTSRKRAEGNVERAAEGARRRYKRLKDREAEAALKRRIRIKMPDGDRPRTGSHTPRRLFHRMVEMMLRGKKGSSSSRGPDGRHSIHFSFTARGFASRTGRRWRIGEAERAALYAVREDALEGGELGWWSNVAQDRNELVAHYRTLESLEKHDRANANVYIVEVIALPAECTARQRRQIVKRLCRWFEERGLGFTVGIHLPDGAGDQRNHHLHLVYSTRPCRRTDPYEWDFAAAKQTDINTPDGIRNRRHALVSAINATLDAAHIDKRYTPLSNHARGMEPPKRGKVGQAATWAARRLAAQEERRDRLLKLNGQVQRLRQGLMEAGTRLAAARLRVERRFVDMTLRIEGLSAEAVRLFELQARMKVRSNEHAGVAATVSGLPQVGTLHALPAADHRIQATSHSVHGVAKTTPLTNLHQPGMISSAPTFSSTSYTEEANDSSNRKVHRSAEVEAESIVRAPGMGSMTQHVHSGSVVKSAVNEPATKLAHAGRSSTARDAAEQRHHELCDRALARLKARRAAIREDAAGRLTVDMNGLPATEREALMRPSYESRLQDQLRAMFLDVTDVEGQARVERSATPAQVVQVTETITTKSPPEHDAQAAAPKKVEAAMMIKRPLQTSDEPITPAPVAGMVTAPSATAGLGQNRALGRPPVSPASVAPLFTPSTSAPGTNAPSSINPLLEKPTRTAVPAIPDVFLDQTALARTDSSGDRGARASLKSQIGADDTDQSRPATKQPGGVSLPPASGSASNSPLVPPQPVMPSTRAIVRMNAGMPDAQVGGLAVNTPPAVDPDLELLPAESPPRTAELSQHVTPEEMASSAPRTGENTPALALPRVGSPTGSPGPIAKGRRSVDVSREAARARAADAHSRGSAGQIPPASRPAALEPAPVVRVDKPDERPHSRERSSHSAPSRQPAAVDGARDGKPMTPPAIVSETSQQVADKSPGTNVAGAAKVPQQWIDPASLNAGNLSKKKRHRIGTSGDEARAMEQDLPSLDATSSENVDAPPPFEGRSAILDNFEALSRQRRERLGK